jgi:hypothetical protein
MQDFCGLANCFALRANVAADNLSPKRAFETEGVEKRATAGYLSGQTDFGDDLGRRD